MITYTYDLDIVPGAVPLVVHLKQYDTDAVLQFKLFSRLGALNLPASSLPLSDVSVRGTKSDKTGYSAVASYSNYVVTVEVDEQMTAVAGKQPFEITLANSDGTLITATFFLDVQRAALDSDTITSESAIREIQQVVTEYINAHPEVLQMLTIGVVHDGHGNVEILPRNVIPDADLMEF